MRKHSSVLEKRMTLSPRLITFLVTFYEALLSVDVKKLDAFICKYQNDSIEAISVFASGIKKDNDAVKNSLIHPHQPHRAIAIYIEDKTNVYFL